MKQEMKDRIERMALRTWDVIGADALTNLEQMGERPEMSRLEVVQMVMDYLDSYGEDREAYEAWKNLKTYRLKENALKGAFPHKRYGW